MLLPQEDQDSLFKVAQLATAFDNDLDMDYIERILKTEGNINYRIPKCFLSNEMKHYAGATALHFTRRFEETKEVKSIELLVKYGADITIQNDKGQTVLHTALEKIKFDIIDDWELRGKLSSKVIDKILSTLVKKSIAKNPGDEHGFTHLHIACMADHRAAVGLFLNNGVPVDLAINENSKFFPKCTPVLVAVKCCALEAVKVLIQHGANLYLKDKRGMNAVHWLVERCRRIIDFLVLEGEERPHDWFTQLISYQEILGLFLKANKINNQITMDEVGLSDLHLSCTVGNASVVRKHLRELAQIDHQVEMNSYLWPGYTPLHFAAHFDLDTVKLLLSKGANIMIKNKNGYTPLDICLERYTVKDIHFIMSTQLSWKSIKLLDGKTKLLDLVLSMRNINRFKLFLDKNIDNINTPVSMDSILWPGFTPLHLAVLLSERTKNRSNYTFVQENDICKPRFDPSFELVEECLTRGADVTFEDPFGCTPVHLAFRYQKMDTIKMLLKYHQSSENPVDNYNVALLHIACAVADEDVTKRLLENGAKFNAPLLSNFKICRRSNDGSYMEHRIISLLIPAGSTPLHIAVASGSHKIVKMLVDRGADVNAVDENGMTPIHRMLIEPGEMNEISRILLTDDLKGIVVNEIGLSHLHVASYFGNVDAVRRLLDNGADVDARLRDESTLNDFEVRYCTREPKWHSYAGNTAWHLSKWNMEIKNVLLEHGADILTRNSKGHTVFHTCEADLELLIKYLSQNEKLMQRVEEDTGLTFLHMVTRLLDAAAVERFIESGANVNARMNDGIEGYGGSTPLHLLMRSSSYINGDDPKKENVTKIMRLLLEAGADVTLCDSEGNTPLHLIVKDEKCHDTFHMHLVKLMLDSLKDFRKTHVGEQGLSLFHIACLQNNVPVIENFVKQAVDINVPVNVFNDPMVGEFEPGGSTLHLIMRSWHYDRSLPQIETIDFLLENGADVNARSVEGNTPIQCAICYVPDRVDIFERLIRAGADLNNVNLYCNTPFVDLLDSRKSTIEAIKLFIESGCNVNGFTSIRQYGHLTFPLHESWDEPDISIDTMETLFMSPDINKFDTEGRTAIHNIVSVPGNWLKNLSTETYSKLIARLCSIGCDVDSQDHAGRTALHFADHFKNNKAINALLMNGADVNVIDKCGKTAFTYCLERHQTRKNYSHIAAIKIFYNHITKLRYLKLHSSHVNVQALLKVCLFYDEDLLNEDRMNCFLKEIDRLKTFVFVEESISFKLMDMLSETGLVAAYPIMGYSKRLVLDAFFKNADIYLSDYTESIGLLKLQYRKAVKRISLISSATESLKISVGFAIPEVCCSILLRFLENFDLENLILATSDQQLAK